MSAVCRLYMVWTVCEWVLYAGCKVVKGVDCV